MNVALVCYASIGGSGIVATELGRALADRGHQVRLISSELPFRFGDYHAGLGFHQVQAPVYPPLREPQYLLSLSNKLVQVSREFDLDVIHAHYAIPHAAAAYLAKRILASTGDAKVPKIITTLHGTDVTLLGSDPSYSQTVAFCIDQSDGVTTVSRSLEGGHVPRAAGEGGHSRDPELSRLLSLSTGAGCPIFVHASSGGDPATKLVMHVSNFRPVKRALALIEIFRRIHERVPSRLILVGEGPDLGLACQRARYLGLGDAIEALGEQDQVVPLLSIADLSLLPSATESFGLAALEAMACEVPVIASRVGGLPEVIEDGVTGFLHPPDAVDAMADSGIALLTDPELA